MTLAIKQAEAFVRNMTTRIPFKYGITTMTDLPHVFVRVVLECDGRVQTGMAADHLPPKWFAKNPTTTPEEDINEMVRVIENSVRLCDDLPPAGSVFELWRELYRLQFEWAGPRDVPPLLANFGVSLVERATIEAFWRAYETTFFRSIRDNSLGVHLDSIHREHEGKSPGDLLSARPRTSIAVRHTVGLSDPLRSSEFSEAERIDDGLPHALDEVIATYEVSHFKIKLSDDPDQDVDRLYRVAAVLVDSGIEGYRFTMDGNENYADEFRRIWSRIESSLASTRFLEHLLFVEQPISRNGALDNATQKGLQEWRDRPLIIIDESDADLQSLPRAMEVGYDGTSHKNCKGVFKGVANACLLLHRSRGETDRPTVLSGEDLANVGVSMLQDSVVSATLGVEHAERNGHHYFQGLSMYPDEWSDKFLNAHPDVYGLRSGLPSLKIREGRISLESVFEAPFGVGVELDPSSLTPIERYDMASLRSPTD